MASVRPPPTEEETHKKNMKHFVQLQRSLESNEEQSYLRAAQALTQWLNNGKAYYTAAKPEILRCLQLARATLKRISGSSLPFTMRSPPEELLGQRRSAYYHLVRVVENYKSTFTDEHQKAILEQLITSIQLDRNVRPPSLPPPVQRTPGTRTRANTSTHSAVQSQPTPSSSRRSSLASELSAETGKTQTLKKAKRVDPPTMPFLPGQGRSSSQTVAGPVTDPLIEATPVPRVRNPPNPSGKNSTPPKTESLYTRTHHPAAAITAIPQKKVTSSIATSAGQTSTAPPIATQVPATTLEQGGSSGSVPHQVPGPNVSPELSRTRPTVGVENMNYTPISNSTVTQGTLPQPTEHTSTGASTLTPGPSTTSTPQVAASVAKEKKKPKLKKINKGPGVLPQIPGSGSYLPWEQADIQWFLSAGGLASQVPDDSEQTAATAEQKDTPVIESMDKDNAMDVETGVLGHETRSDATTTPITAKQDTEVPLNISDIERTAVGLSLEQGASEIPECVLPDRVTALTSSPRPGESSMNYEEATSGVELPAAPSLNTHQEEESPAPSQSQAPGMQTALNPSHRELGDAVESGHVTQVDASRQRDDQPIDGHSGSLIRTEQADSIPEIPREPTVGGLGSSSVLHEDPGTVGSTSPLPVHQLITIISRNKDGLKRVREAFANFLAEEALKRTRTRAVTNGSNGIISDSSEGGEVKTPNDPVPCGPSRFHVDNIVLADFEVGLPRSGDTVKLCFDMSDEQLGQVNLWSQWYKRNIDLSHALCISIACYSSKVLLQWDQNHEQTVEEVVTELIKHKSLWPSNNKLYMDAGGEQMSLSPPPLMVTDEGLVDISALVRTKSLVVHLQHYDDMSNYLFVLFAHPPTQSQLDRVNLSRRNKWKWEKALHTFSQPFPLHSTLTQL